MANFSFNPPDRIHLNKRHATVPTAADVLRQLDPQINASLDDAARASLTARADALEAQAAEVGPRDPRYSELTRRAELLRGSVSKVGVS
jgi:uncharacterized protein involved in exopolysaccharide biosynthesis